MNSIPLVAGISLITPSRLENLVAAAELTRDVPGDMAELGVYKGGSALVLADLMPQKTLHLFDTFSGLPHNEEWPYNPKGHDLSKGRFYADVEDVIKLLIGRDTRFHIGRFSDVTNRPWEHMLPDKPFSFVHIDCDLYQSAKDAIHWFWPRMNVGGIMFFDDYGCEFTGVTEAVHEKWPLNELHLQHGDGFQIGCYVMKV